MNAIPLLKRANKGWRLTGKLTIALVAIIAIGGYALYRLKDTWRGPALLLAEPANGATVHENLIQISGDARRTARLQLNNRDILTDEQGQFAEKLLLAPGYNIIKLRASDRFGRRLEKSLELVYRPAS